MTAARVDFTVARKAVLELARDLAPIPGNLRHVALALEHPRGAAEGFLEWIPGGNFKVTAAGAALLETWKRERRGAGAVTTVPTLSVDGPCR